MDTHHLIKMANNIAAFFETDPDPSRRAKAVAEHLRLFWEPRMRREILSHVDSHHGEGLKPLVMEALTNHRKELEG